MVKIIEGDTKICRDCKREKDINEFYISRIKKNHVSRCKPCYAEHRKASTKRYIENNKDKIKKRSSGYTKSHPEKRRAYYYKNREKLMEANKASYNKYRVANIKKRKDWYLDNKESHAVAREKYATKNKDRLRAARRKWENNRLLTDVQYALQKQLAWRIRSAAKGKYKKNQRTETIIGCTISFFKTHIESLFTEGMNWDNWTTNGWHLDHKIPLSWFDLTNENCRKIAFSYKNMQPLWSEENLEKKNFYHHEMIY